MRPSSTAVFSPLFQRCTTVLNGAAGTPFPGQPHGHRSECPAPGGRCRPENVESPSGLCAPPVYHARNLGRWRYTTDDCSTPPPIGAPHDDVSATAAHAATGGLVKSVVALDRVVIRLAGDSGDGMQLTGNRFTSETASFGNDLSTLPNFPAEIRAPTGTLPGVSSFQLHFADHDIMTPGDAPDVLVAMNPAALKANLADLPGGGLLILDSDEFTPRNLAKVGYATNPLEDGSLEGWQTVSGAADVA